MLFRVACEQGVYEAANMDLLTGLARPGAWHFDVGGNIGLMAAPILSRVPDCHVLSFEPSLNVLPYLQRTVAESPFADRWAVVPKAVGAKAGRVKFSLSSPNNSPYDGMRATQRVASEQQVDVELTTIDAEWKRLGSPRVSAIKIDVEGAELEVLKGAADCLLTERPPVLLEWNAENLAAYQCPPEYLLTVAREMNWQVFAQPHLVEVHTHRELSLHMLRTESFLLSPR
ncbi:MAG TPA: FkbM family methyltransferase [Candidatus Acidoferrum sp.]|jgi:FkbM family methyltransferase|nr:FkbM family methyltransferase [Candidatus Acidoferrum sp.]